MADDIKAENYKKSVERLADDWSKEVAPLVKQLDPLVAELDKLKAIKDPSAEDKKQIDDLTKKCADLRKKIDVATLEFNTSLRIIQDPVRADEKELVKVPTWFKDIIKRKGIPVSKHVTIVPNIDFDLKKKKLKSGGLTLKWEF